MRARGTLLALVLFFIVYFYAVNESNTDHPPTYEARNFPLLKQPDGVTCGPTSAAMLANYYGRRVSINDMREDARTDWFKFKGQAVGLTVPGQMAIALKKHGVSATYTTGTVDELKHLIAEGRYPIVLVRSGQRLLHYVVAIGYSETAIIIADPGSGTREVMQNRNFLGAWSFTTDMNGSVMDRIMSPLLQAAGVNGNTMIVPTKPL